MPLLGKVDAVVTDPPYGKVKGEFDEAWTNRANMLPDVELWVDVISQKIKSNGTLWWFAWPSLAGRIEDRIARRMNVLAHVVWQKPAATGQKASKEALRAPMPITERIIMAEHYGSDVSAMGQAGYRTKCNEVARLTFGKYITATRAAHQLTMKALTEAVGAYGAVNHGGACSNWENGNNIPTLDQYQKLQSAFPGCFDREYEELRKEYEELRKEYEELRRYFDCRAGDQFSDVWNFSSNKDATGHPTTKPLALMEYLVRLSVRPSGVCLDPFMGSGTTLVACQKLGRSGIGIELDPDYFAIACKRVDEATRQPDMFVTPPAPAATQEGFDL
jgi:site-specific DNA-methyltransferase (adenine-specific)